MDRKISVVGLGYVGLPVALAFAEIAATVGFDKNSQRIEELNNGFDRTNEVTREQLDTSTIQFSADPADLKQADFHIVAVPTPIDHTNQPDLTILLNASNMLGEQLKPGDIVVYESTVYPGATEEECVPVLEKASGLTCGIDFKVGYSPERINPGDKEHTFKKIIKVVAGQDEETLNIIADVYNSVVDAGVHRASSIKVAEAAKAIENAQRDLNIAFMNELSLIFNLLDIDTLDVLAAAKTKWNFLPFSPGLVGGHCIGVDPYYLTHKAQTVGYHPEVLLAGRRINDNMGKYIAEQTIKHLIHCGHKVRGARIGIFGLTFKEDCPDLRNSRVIDIITELESYGTNVLVHDPLADVDEAEKEYGVHLRPLAELSNLDAIVFAVAHQHYLDMSRDDFTKHLTEKAHITDVKGLFSVSDFADTKFNYWRI